MRDKQHALLFYKQFFNSIVWAWFHQVFYISIVDVSEHCLCYYHSIEFLFFIVWEILHQMQIVSPQQTLARSRQFMIFSEINLLSQRKWSFTVKRTVTGLLRRCQQSVSFGCTETIRYYNFPHYASPLCAFPFLFNHFFEIYLVALIVLFAILSFGTRTVLNGVRWKYNVWSYSFYTLSNQWFSDIPTNG